MAQTKEQYHNELDKCRDLFEKKTRDYGTAWRILRTSSLTDQIFIKANRIRTIQESGENKVGEDIRDEFIGIVNYGVMGLIQLDLPEDEGFELDPDRVMSLYNQWSNTTYELMEKKNHDYLRWNTIRFLKA